MSIDTTNINYTPSHNQILRRGFYTDSGTFKYFHPEIDDPEFCKLQPDIITEEFHYNFKPDPSDKPIPMCKIQPGYFVIYNKYHRHQSHDRTPSYVLDDAGNKVYFSCHRCHINLSTQEISDHQKYCNSCLNLLSNQHKGDLSPKSFSRLTSAIDWLFLLAKPKRAYNEFTQKWFTFKVAMLTLSLPCQQIMHDYDPRPDNKRYTLDPATNKKTFIPNPLSEQAQSDLYIKNKILNQFFQVLRKKHNLHNYVWRAESKLNGTIHFHILLDIYVHYKEYNRIWNEILKQHGYIDLYRENQQKFHKHGFRYRANLDRDYDPITGHKQRRWTKSQQLQAYKFGMATNWTQPSGTTDIHSMKGIKNTRLYMGKYVSKKVDIAKGCDYYRKNIAKSKPNPLHFVGIVENLEEDVKNALSINGNIWYLSESLSKNKGIKIEITDDINDEINMLSDSSPKSIQKTEHCTIFYFNIRELASSPLPAIHNVLKSNITNIRNKYYPPGQKSYSILGSPLPIFDNL